MLQKRESKFKQHRIILKVAKVKIFLKCTQKHAGNRICYVNFKSNSVTIMYSKYNHLVKDKDKIDRHIFGY